MYGYKIFTWVNVRQDVIVTVRSIVSLVGNKRVSSLSILALSLLSISPCLLCLLFVVLLVRGIHGGHSRVSLFLRGQTFPVRQRRLGRESTTHPRDLSHEDVLQLICELPDPLDAPAIVLPRHEPLLQLDLVHECGYIS